MHLWLIALMVLGLSGTIAAAPLSSPPTVTITPPSADLPSEVAALSGVWEGTWEGAMLSRLAVEELNRGSALVVYAWADHPRRWVPGGWRRVRAKAIPGGRFQWADDPQGTVSYTFGLAEDPFTLTTDPARLRLERHFVERGQTRTVGVVTMQKVPAARLTDQPFLAPLTPSSPPTAGSLPRLPALAEPVTGPPRVALVIGNAAYRDSPLRNPVHDATDLAARLRHLGFSVLLVQDADRPTMERAVRDFTSAPPPDSLGLFYFSGHGVQLEGLNYLLPVGSTFSEPSDVKYHAITADWVLARMEAAGMGVKLLILDACRNNPFGKSWERGLNRGLANMEAVTGSLIAYATSPGRTATDGWGRHSTYTRHLLDKLATPGLPVELLFKAVRVAVQIETNGRQTPWESSSLTGDVYFAGPPGTPPVSGPLVPPPAPEARPAVLAPLPDDIRITPPAATVPPALAAFVGRWAGHWDGVVPHLFIVEEVQPPHARVIYATGAAPTLGKVRPSWSRLEGTFVDGVLELTLARPATARYRFQPDGTLDATYEWASGITRAQLTRVPD